MEEKKMEEQMKALQKRVSELEQTIQDKDKLLVSISHEIRTPINTLLGMNEMIMRESSEREIIEYAADIYNAGQTLLELVNNLTEFSKLQKGIAPISNKEYSTFDLIKDCYNAVAFRAKEKNLHLLIHCDELLPSVLEGDRLRIQQIVLNILTNAIEYTSDGTVTVEITSEKLMNERTALCFSVTDTGLGLTPEEVQKMTEEFAKYDVRDSAILGATNLGLSICRNLVHQMGGRIGVQSVYGEGSTFWIRVPQRIIDEEPLGDFFVRYQENSERKKKYSASFKAPDAAVLVVDDMKLNREVIRLLLKNTDIQLDLAVGGAECIEKTKEKKYDVIFMDHKMPEMDGVQTFQAIRQMEGNPNRDTPVIALTANTMDGIEKYYLQTGFEAYLAKPIKGVELEQILLSVLPAERIRIE